MYYSLTGKLPARYIIRRGLKSYVHNETWRKDSQYKGHAAAHEDQTPARVRDGDEANAHTLLQQRMIGPMQWPVIAKEHLK